MRLPIWERAHEFFHWLRDVYSSGLIAQLNGVKEQTVDAWCREKPTVVNPLHTGRANPIDRIYSNLALAHQKDAGKARETAEGFVLFIDHLDEQQVLDDSDVCERLEKLYGKAAKEHAEIIEKIFEKDEPDWSEVWTEIYQFESAFRQFRTCVKRKRDEQVKNHKITTNGNGQTVGK